MFIFKVFLIFSAIIVAQVLGRLGIYRKVSFTEHIKLEKKFKCSVPQPRSFLVSELMKNATIYQGVGNGFSPAFTVLHQCGAAGCCPHDDEECVPIRKEDVKLIISMRGKESWSFNEFIAENHTACGCEKKLSSIK